MTKICLTVAFVCLFALHGVFQAEAANDGPACRNLDRTQVIDTAKSVIQTCDEVLKLYNELVEHFGSTSDTKQTASGISELKTHLTNGIDLYEKSPKPVSEWCSQTTPLLTTYRDGASTHKDKLTKALVDGQKILNDAQNGLHKSGLSINSAGGELAKLEYNLAHQFDENAKYIMDAQREAVKTIVPELKKKVASIRAFFEDFACTQDKVTLAFIAIGDIKTEASATKAFVSVDENKDIHDKAIKSASNVIDKCNNYRKKYE